jgi:hypothetical protein
MNEELLRKKYLADGSFMLVCPVTLKAFGGMLISPFYDAELEESWIELNNYDRYNFFVVEIKNYIKPISEFRNFNEESLEDFLERFEFLENIEEDTVEYFEYYKKIEIYNKLKKQCFQILGEEYFE